MLTTTIKRECSFSYFVHTYIYNDATHIWFCGNITQSLCHFQQLRDRDHHNNKYLFIKCLRWWSSSKMSVSLSFKQSCGNLWNGLEKYFVSCHLGHYLAIKYEHYYICRSCYKLSDILKMSFFLGKTPKLLLVLIKIDLKMF